MSIKIEVPKKILESLYLKKGLSSYKVAEIYGCDPSVIQKRLKENNIPLIHKKERIDITKRKLYDLYVKKKLSSYKIAKLLGIGRTTIYCRLVEYGIETRPKKVVYISKSELIKLYNEEKLSSLKIARKYHCSHSIILDKLKAYGLKRRTGSEALTIYQKKPFEGGPIKKAYMIGFRLGDLNVRKFSNNSKNIELKVNTTKEDQVDLMKRVFGMYGHFYCKKIKKVYYVSCLMDLSFNFLLKKEDKIEEWILKQKDYFFAFLGGYVDAEGNIGVYSGQARFRVGSYDKKLLFQAYKKLNLMGINTKFVLETPRGIYGERKHNGDFYRVSVNCKPDLLRLFKLIKPYIKHKKRYNNLISAEKNIIERNKKYGAEVKQYD